MRYLVRPQGESASLYSDGPAPPFNPATLIAGIVGVGATAVAGTAFAIYYEVGRPLRRQANGAPAGHAAHACIHVFVDAF